MTAFQRFATYDSLKKLEKDIAQSTSDEKSKEASIRAAKSISCVARIRRNNTEITLTNLNSKTTLADLVQDAQNSAAHSLSVSTTPFHENSARDELIEISVKLPKKRLHDEKLKTWTKLNPINTTFGKKSEYSSSSIPTPSRGCTASTRSNPSSSNTTKITFSSPMADYLPASYFRTLRVEFALSEHFFELQEIPITTVSESEVAERLARAIYEYESQPDRVKMSGLWCPYPPPSLLRLTKEIIIDEKKEKSEKKKKESSSSDGLDDDDGLDEGDVDWVRIDFRFKTDSDP